MNSLPPLPTSDPRAAAAEAARGDGAREDAAAERAGRRLRMLVELGDIGMELARDVRRQALGETGDETGDETGQAGVARAGADFVLMFARIARAVRQTVALEARLDAETQAQAQQGTSAQKTRATAERKRVRQQKDRVRHFVEAAIADAGEGHDSESLLLDLDERLEDPDIEDELGQRPIGVIVAGICADLGIEVDLSHFMDAELGFDMASMNPQPGAGGGFPVAGGSGVLPNGPEAEAWPPPAPTPPHEGEGKSACGFIVPGAERAAEMARPADTGDPGGRAE